MQARLVCPEHDRADDQHACDDPETWLHRRGPVVPRLGPTGAQDHTTRWRRRPKAADGAPPRRGHRSDARDEAALTAMTRAAPVAALAGMGIHRRER